MIKVMHVTPLDDLFRNVGRLDDLKLSRNRYGIIQCSTGVYTENIARGGVSRDSSIPQEAKPSAVFISRHISMQMLQFSYTRAHACRQCFKWFIILLVASYWANMDIVVWAMDSLSRGRRQAVDMRKSTISIATAAKSKMLRPLQINFLFPVLYSSIFACGRRSIFIIPSLF